MPSYCDEKTKIWYCKFYYTDYTGIRKQKKKRGFKLQREAKEWERNFLETRNLDANIKFKNFVSQYFKNAESRLKESTLENKKHIVEKKYYRSFQI